MTGTGRAATTTVGERWPGLRRWVRVGLTPLLLAWIAATVGWALLVPEDRSLAIALKSIVMVALLLAIEVAIPYQRRWRMTRQHLLRRDLPFLVANGALVAGVDAGWTLLVVDVASRTEGWLTGRALWVQVIVALLAFEALQYGLHRAMHESRGPITHFLWRAHAIHHLPQQLYLVMHAVFHPLNGVLVRVFVQLLPLWLLGTDPVAMLVASSLIGFCGTISHFNVDLRAGFLNYLIVGPELHRYHHSADSHEAVNYAAALPVFDLCFGTFLYRPGVPPANLGLREEDGYPGQHALWQAFRFPSSLRPVEPRAERGQEKAQALS